MDEIQKIALDEVNAERKRAAIDEAKNLIRQIAGHQKTIADTTIRMIECRKQLQKISYSEVEAE
jgi:hypothetical protein